MRNIKKLIALGLTTALAMSILAGCGGSSSGSASTGSGTSGTEASSESSGRTDVIAGLTQEPATLDPNNMGDGAGFQVASNIYEGLTWINDDLEVEELLAESWDISDDGLEYTFHLREGVKFHNGEPLTAEDCVYTYDRAAQGGYAGSVMGIIKSYEAVDENTFKVTLNYAYAPALECFGSNYLRIVNKKAVEECGDSFAYNPIGAGTGPYCFVEWNSGNNIKLKANEDYWRSAAPIKDVEIRFISDSTTMDNAIETHEIDYATVSGSAADNFESKDDITTNVTGTTIVNYIGFNTKTAPFDNKEVRQAIAYSIDKDALQMTSYNGGQGGVVSATVVPQNGFGCDTALEPYPQDIEKAKELLKSAGFENGFETTIYTPNAPWRKNIATYLQSCLAEIGITANIETMEQAALLDEIRAGNCPIFIMGFSGTAGDADFFYFSQYHSGQTYDYTQFSTPELDTMLEDARAEQDTTARKDMYKEIAEYIYDACPDIPNFHIGFIYGHDSNLTASYAPFVRLYVYNWAWK